MKKPKPPAKRRIDYRRQKNGVQTSLPPDYPTPKHIPAKPKIPSISTISLVPKHGEIGGDYKSYYVNHKTKHLPHAQMLVKFEELVRLRRACWEAAISVQRAVVPILEYVHDHVDDPVGDVRDQAPYATTRVGARAQIVEWLLTADGRSLVFRKAITGIIESQRGLTDWLPRSLLGKNYDDWRRRCRTALAAYDRLRSTIALSNLGLSMRFARRMKDRGGFSFDDLVNEGFFGLLEAVDRFDHTRGLRFSTYATHWIRHAINRCLENNGRMVRIPVHMQVNHAHILRIRDELDGDPQAISERLDMSIKTATAILSRQPVFYSHASLSAPVGDDDRGAVTLGDFLESDDPAPDDLAYGAQRRQMLERILQPLPDNLRDILMQRFGMDGDPQTLEQIGKKYGICRERVRQLQNVAIDKLRKIMTYDQLRAQCLGGETDLPVDTKTEPKNDVPEPSPSDFNAHRLHVVEFFAILQDPMTFWPISKIAKATNLRTYQVRNVCHQLVREGLLRKKRAKYAGLLDGVIVERLVLSSLTHVPTPPGPLAQALGLRREVVAAALLRMADAGQIRRDRRAYSRFAANDAGG